MKKHPNPLRRRLRKNELCAMKRERVFFCNRRHGRGAEGRGKYENGFRQNQQGPIEESRHGKLTLREKNTPPIFGGLMWGGSSVGRASRSQCEGRGFDPLPLHQFISLVFNALEIFCFSVSALIRRKCGKSAALPRLISRLVTKQRNAFNREKNHGTGIEKR